MAHNPDLEHIPPPTKASDEPRQLNPMKFMTRGEDTLDVDNPSKVIFSDFRPSVLPSDAVIEEVPVPKGSSVQVLADSRELMNSLGVTIVRQAVQTPADKANGTPNQPVTGKQASSSQKKTG